MARTEQTRRGVTIHRAADAIDLEQTDFMTAPTASEETQALFGELGEIGETLAAGTETGAVVKVLVRQSVEEAGFSLLHVWFKANYPLPRHSHNADCLYYVISGSAIMGAQTLRAGDSFFVPADAPYVYAAGPDGVEVLEIRFGVDQFDMKIADAPSTRWQAMADEIVANRDGWAAERTSPTFAANQA